MTITLELLRQHVSRAIGLVLWLHVPLVAALAWALAVPMTLPVAATLILTGMAELFAVRRPQAATSHLIFAIVYAAQVAILVGLMRDHPWQADMHMYFFAALAIIGALCSWPAILAFVGFVAVHHLALNFLMSELVFVGPSDFGRVVMHAVILVAEGVALGALTYLLETIFTAQAHVLQTAEKARATAEGLLSHREEEQAAQSGVVARLIERITDLAGGDYSRQLQASGFPSEYESVVNALNLLGHRLSAAVTTVATAARGVQESGDSLVSSARALEGSAADQAALLDRARSAFSGLGQGIGATVVLASQADEAMQENRAEVARGTNLLGEVVEAMGLIEQSTGQIRQIVEVMDNIAFQTNLLALNAGVEAARAGETGRGFAVVASEVRALAQRAAESAREIRGLIDQGQGNVELGTRKVGQTTQALESLIATAQKAAGFVSEIAGQINQQGQGLHGLQDEVNSLEAQARHNANLAGRILSAGNELQRHSGELGRGMAELEGNGARIGRRAA
ncbi:methyl-accepting chemotaxis protein [Stagnihabitans tardus]|uniref:Methyl-accepting chemotaxis protein n=1 Tax=Stagnihabitans tardus TaxID=2699202 RepID=A0AAE4YCM1_9RHOB|nr:methyl-accepting chemotaxis protein [Stagnihabitans tardus]NBZ88976.1 hypothetical protein [Stagnihabitans tardus]